MNWPRGIGVVPLLVLGLMVIFQGYALAQDYPELGDTLLIPESALVDRNRKRVVYRLNDGVAEEVEPGLAVTVNDELLPVLHGLYAGDEIIISGLNTVVAGTRVEVVQAVGSN